MTSPFERRLSKAEAATAAGAEARIISVATPELAEGLWSAALAKGEPAGLIIVVPGQGPAVIVGSTIDEMMQRVATIGRRIHDEGPASMAADGSYLWRAPRGQQGQAVQ